MLPEVPESFRSGTIQFWQCTKNNCPGRMHENILTEVCTIKTEHLHGRKTTKVKLREQHELVKNLAALPIPGDELPLRTIVGMAAEGLTAEQLASLPNEDALRHTVHRARYKPETAVVNKVDVDEIVIDVCHRYSYDLKNKI